MNLERVNSGNEAGSRRKLSEPLVLLAIGTVAITVRLLFLASWAEIPLFHSPMGDELNFHQTALSLIGSDEKPPAFFYQPLYSFYLALVYFLFGVDVATARTIQLLIGVGTTLLFYGLGRELGGKACGRWGGLLTALYGPLVFLEGQLLAEGIVVPMVAGAIWCLLVAMRKGRHWMLIPSGVLLGWAMMGRPNLIAILPVIGLWVLVKCKNWKARLLAAAWGTLGVLIGVLPSWLYNISQGESSSMVSASGGHSFYIGNNPDATGAFHVPDGEKIDDSSHDAYRQTLTQLAEQAQGRKLNPSEVSTYWYKRGLAFWKEQPGVAARLLARKLLLALNSTEAPIHHSYIFGQEVAPVLRYLLTFGIWFPFSVLGILWGIRRKPGVGLMASCASAYLLSLIIFYVADRYRILLIPMLLPLAGVGVVELVHRMKVGKVKELAVAAGFFLGSFGITQLPLISEESQRSGMSSAYNLMGKAVGDQGDLAQAEKYFQKGIELAGPGHGAVCRSNLGLLLLRRGDSEDAEKLFLEAAQIDPDYAFPKKQLAQLNERRGDIEEAIRWWQEVEKLQVDPGPAQGEISRLKRLLEK